MDNHIKKLLNLCRICGQRALKYSEITRKKKAKIAGNYSHLIKLLFGIDIDNDIEDIHPKVLCQPCYWKLINSKKDDRPLSLSQVDRDRKAVIIWKQHDDEECFTCNIYQQQSKAGQWNHDKKMVRDGKKQSSVVCTPEKTDFTKNQDDGLYVSLKRALSSPLSKEEEKVHTSLIKRKLNLSADKKSVVCKTGGQVNNNLDIKLLIRRDHIIYHYCLNQSIDNISLLNSYRCIYKRTFFVTASAFHKNN